MKIFFIVILVIFAIYYFFNKDTYMGFYYPNGCLTCTDDYIFSPVFNKRQDCLSWASNLKRERNNFKDDFECGKNCKTPQSKDDFYVCEETFDY